MAESPGSIVRDGYLTSTSSPTSSGEDKLSGSDLGDTNGNSGGNKFTVFVIFICCCGLSLVFLAAFLWRKYTRASNCDTTSSNMQQQYQVQQHQYSIEPNQQIYLNKGGVSSAEMGMMSTPTTQSGGPKGPDGGCLNCRLIQMGSAISYGDNRCPQCGEQVS